MNSEGLLVPRLRTWFGEVFAWVLLYLMYRRHFEYWPFLLTDPVISIPCEWF